MAVQTIPTGSEVFFNRDTIIVSKTNLKGMITYANMIFLDIAGFKETEVLGKPHNLIRHPHMPRCIFRLLWDTVKKGDEIFAYVVNMTKNGDHYWVFAHVTPTYNNHDEIISYHSNRRVPDPDIIKNVIKPLYDDLLAIESKYSNVNDAIESSTAELLRILKQKGMSYDEFIFSI